MTSSNRSDNRDQWQRRQDREPKGSQSARPFHKKEIGNRKDQLPVGGQLAHYQVHWRKLFPQHPKIVRKVSQGILIAFDDIPPSLLRYPLELRSNDKTADLLHAVQKLQVSQAIEEVMDTTSPGYYSCLFLVPKPDGSFHPIINLKKLNQFLIVPSLKMETLLSIITALQPQEWIIKIDLKDAYHHILVHVNIRKCFRFVKAGVVYQFGVLPFGLSTAPREFTKTLAPVVQLLRTQGIRVHAYLDDWIIRAHSREQSLEHTQHILQLLQSLDWTINWDKSMLQTSRILDFLGLHFNLEGALISPPDSFLPTLTNVQSGLSQTTVMPARKISSIISRMSHFAPFIYSGRLHLRFLQFWFKAQWSQHQQSWDTPIQLNADFLTYLRWFQRQNVMTGVPLHLPEPSLFFFTDASLKGWGASWKDLQIFRPMVSSGITTSYKLAGTGSHPTCATSLGTSVGKSICESLLRQQYSSSVHPQTGGNTCSVPVSQNPGTVRTLRPMLCPESVNLAQQNGAFQPKPWTICSVSSELLW